MEHLVVTSPQNYQQQFYEHIGLKRVPFCEGGEAWENPDVGFVHGFGDMESVHCGIGSYTIPVDLTVQYDYEFSYLHFGTIYRGVTYTMVDGQELAGPAPSSFVIVEQSPVGANRWKTGQQARGTEVSICVPFLERCILPFLGVDASRLDFLGVNLRHTRLADSLKAVIKRVEVLMGGRAMTRELLMALCGEFVAQLVQDDVRHGLVREEAHAVRVEVGGRATVIDKEDFRAIEAAHRYIEHDAANFPGIAMLARELGISEQKLKAGFKHRYGQTVWEYANAVRMARAAELLRGTSATVGAVAGEVGYRSQSAFIAMFAKWSGLSPSRYRAIGRTGVDG